MLINPQLLATFQRLSGSGYELVREFEALAGGVTLEQIIEQITVDRFRMGEGSHDIAQRLLAAGIHTEDCYCAVISRNYYAMYQAGRGVVFHTRQVDIDPHERLVQAVRDTLGDAAGNVLDEWRRLRSQVDYSPYPDLSGETLPDCAQRSATAAADFPHQCRAYLQARGVTV